MTASATATQEVFGASTFKATARDYRAHRPMVDVLVKLGYGKEGFNPDNIVQEALDVIKTLEIMADNGSAYTPDNGQGFGSENGSNIADSILGRRRSASSLKSAFSKVGA